MVCARMAFIDEVPEYEAKEGRIYIRMADFTLAMPVHIFLAGCDRGRLAIAKWQVDALDKVVPIKP